MIYSEEELLYNYSDYYNGGLEEPCQHQTSHRVELILVQYFLPIICVLGLLGNALVILTYACYKRTRSMTDVFLLNVAVADLMFVLTLPLYVGSQVWVWAGPAGVAACKLVRGSYSVNLYSSTLLLACVSVDRYVAIVQARRSFRLRSLMCSRVACGAVWLCALLLSVPTFYFYTSYQPSHTSPSFMEPEDNTTTPEPPSHVCEFRFADSQVAKAVKVAVPSTQMAVGFFLPLCVMSGCYGAVIVTLMKAKNFQRHKAVRVVLAVVAVFVACHVPYNVALLFDTVILFDQQSCSASDGRRVALTLTQTLAYLHSCLNPLLYAFVGVQFRSHFRRIFRDLWCLGKRSLGHRRSSRATSEVFVSSSRRSVDGSSNNGSSFTM